jgi:hypothetical protein
MVMNNSTFMSSHGLPKDLHFGVNLFGFDLAAEFTKRSVFGTCLIVFASPSTLITLADIFQRGKSELTAKIFICCEVISPVFYLIPLLTLGPLGFILLVLVLKVFVFPLKHYRFTYLPENKNEHLIPSAATPLEAQNSNQQNFWTPKTINQLNRPTPWSMDSQMAETSMRK